MNKNVKNKENKYGEMNKISQNKPEQNKLKMRRQNKHKIQVCDKKNMAGERKSPNKDHSSGVAKSYYGRRQKKKEEGNEIGEEAYDFNKLMEIVDKNIKKNEDLEMHGEVPEFAPHFNFHEGEKENQKPRRTDHNNKEKLRIEESKKGRRGILESREREERKELEEKKEKEEEVGELGLNYEISKIQKDEEKLLTKAKDLEDEMKAIRENKVNFVIKQFKQMLVKEATEETKRFKQKIGIFLNSII
jgi:hypothetical protein